VTFHLGSVTIDRVLDIDEIFFPSDYLFPDATRSAVDELSHGFVDEQFDRDSGMMRQAFAAYLIRGAGPTVLVDAGVGRGKHRPFHPWHRRTDDYFLRNLAAVGCTTADVDYVVSTHLHADHVGWNTELVDGVWVPTFERARYLLARPEIAMLDEEYVADPEVCLGSYRDSIVPLREHGVADLFDDEHHLSDEISLSVRPGHTPGTTVVRVASGSETAFITGDVIHHEVQLLKPEWSSAFCFEFDRAAAVRRRTLTEVAETGAILMPAHFPPCRLQVSGGGFETRSVGQT
jgi:glyoxylase-like metal-dependent hydrolase (beta-lactamase superfamily II)